MISIPGGSLGSSEVLKVKNAKQALRVLGVPIGSPTSVLLALIRKLPREVATFELATYSRQALCRPVTNYFPYLSCIEHCVKEHVLALKCI